jgi:tetratricopeptide (TPR) repeat protein
VKSLTAQQTYSREAVCRLVGISERQLRAWEKQELIPAAEVYGFSDLIALRTLSSLKQSGVRPVRVREALTALRGKLKDVADPLRELKVYSDGKRIGVHVAGQRMEPVTGQLLFDFDSEYLKKLLSFTAKAEAPAAPKQRQTQQEAESWFQKGLDLEQTGAPIEQAISAYEQAIAADAASGGALVNLGTIYFKKRDWKQAEKYYRRAIEADPNYALAQFNLGNLFDERGDCARAVEHYQSAVTLDPNYADAHYNMALLYQGMGQPMKALKHWQGYLKLDPSSSWAAIARREMEAIRKSAVVPKRRVE